MGKKSKGTHKVSMGGRLKSNKAHEEKRQAKFAAKREAGNAYVYEKNPYKEGTNEYEREKMDRYEKNKSSRVKVAQLDSINAKLDNLLAKRQLENKKLRKD